MMFPLPFKKSNKRQRGLQVNLGFSLSGRQCRANTLGSIHVAPCSEACYLTDSLALFKQCRSIFGTLRKPTTFETKTFVIIDRHDNTQAVYFVCSGSL